MVRESGTVKVMVEVLPLELVMVWVIVVESTTVEVMV